MMQGTHTAPARRNKECYKRCCGLLDLQVSSVASPLHDFGRHVEEEMEDSDNTSRRYIRNYQLYSRSSRKHLQIFGKRVDALGEDGSENAEVIVETDTFGSRVRIKGASSGFYLCMNARGKLIGKRRGKSRTCLWKELIDENKWTAFESVEFPGWNVAFNRRGRPRKAPMIKRGKETQFMKRLLPRDKVKLTNKPEFDFSHLTTQMHHRRRHSQHTTFYQ
ncbi:PREDICTED: fibroblast growth factor 8b-like [Branchiostoma belcheri]|uniref:Fibroblast growth factor 8b-like n=1 Tax=Branchiostoma belcheri TaxID=7741 RepID=A0A6P4YWZ5_BRABE|nr:PREDICTED: fibroblast growth factor 8b-like [Branchiostoma belcheri]